MSGPRAAVRLRHLLPRSLAVVTVVVGVNVPSDMRAKGNHDAQLLGRAVPASTATPDPYISPWLAPLPNVLTRTESEKV